MLVADGWSWVILVAGGVVLWLAAMVIVVALCAAAARGDELLDEMDRADKERAALGRACSRGIEL